MYTVIYLTLSILIYIYCIYIYKYTVCVCVCTFLLCGTSSLSAYQLDEVQLSKRCLRVAVHRGGQGALCGYLGQRQGPHDSREAEHVAHAALQLCSDLDGFMEQSSPLLCAPRTSQNKQCQHHRHGLVPGFPNTCGFGYFRFNQITS